MEKKIYLGNDTAGYELKMKCIEYLEGKRFRMWTAVLMTIRT